MNSWPSEANPLVSDADATRARPPLIAAIAAVALIAAGMGCFSRDIQGLGLILVNDDLRSIGLLVPPASIWLAYRAWSWRDWTDGGSWWGLVLMFLPLALALLKHAGPTGIWVQVGPYPLQFATLPLSLELYTYFSGAVLLFGGTRAWRKGWFPIALWLFIEPVPHFLEYLVDLPLQTLAAQVTRGFAHWLAVPVEGDALKMMFSPGLGIFIAPGCNGLRGAATMGYLALVIGYLYRLRPVRWALFVVAAVGLAYLLNFVRLCGVVIYYWFALRLPEIGRHGAAIDYAIGGVIFFAAGIFLLRAPRRWASR